MIGKVTRGSDVRRLLYYLYGPGKAIEHTDPHMIAGFGDPAELEPERLGDGCRDFRRLAGLLNQPLAALNGDNYPQPVWHCSVRAAPEDRVLSDAEWARVAAHIMDRTGLASDGDDLAVRWVAVRHASDHVHLVATLARQDRHRPSLWNTYRKLRAACRDTEEWFGLRRTAPADRTAAKRPTRAETEQAIRRGQAEAARVRLRREVSTAAAGARTEEEFFTRLARMGVLVRHRFSAHQPGQVTGYAVGLPDHTTKDGQTVWFGGGKLAADLTLPRLRARWGDPQARDPLHGAAALPAPAVRAVLRATIAEAATQGGRGSGVLRPAAGGRSAGAGAPQRGQHDGDHRLRRHIARLHRGGRGAPLVWRRAAARQPHPAPAPRRLGTGSARRGEVFRGGPVHCPGTHRDLPARHTAGRRRRGAPAPLRRQ